MKNITDKNTNNQTAEVLEKIESLKIRAAAYVESVKQQPITKNMIRVIVKYSSTLDYKKQFAKDDDAGPAVSNNQS